ncbi:MAG: hypothetical protein LBI79_05515 [Nitrososphaerota archaeon]|jgi:hypothetical protein|nr:hypothetical protein [Nitrososphaerota archaeon]
MTYLNSSWLVKTDPDGEEQWHQQYDNHIITDNQQYNYRIKNIVQAMSGQYLALSDSGIIAIDDLGNKLWALPYVEYVLDLKNPSAATVMDVSSIVSSDGNLVVVVNYILTAIYPNSIDGPFGLWIANFALASIYPTDGNGLYVELVAGVAVIAVVATFVGLLVYLKKYMNHRD